MKATDLLIVGIIIGFILFYNIRKYWRKFRLNRTMKKAKKAEKRAAVLLEKNGYNLLTVQKRTTITTWVDGQPFNNQVQADFVVEKHGKVYVVEVKTGSQATKITTSATRRQLLEYYYVYQPDGILLLDMELEQIQEIKFELDQKMAKISSSLVYLLLSFALGLITGVFLYKGGLG